MASAHLKYLSAGGNRHPAAADWNHDLLAYGSGNNIALWDPLEESCNGASTLLTGHTDTVNAIKIWKSPGSDEAIIISGSSDRTVRIWCSNSSLPYNFRTIACLAEHQGSVNTLAILPECGHFVTGAADATLKVWRLDLPVPAYNNATMRASNEKPFAPSVHLLQTIALKPRFFPLASSLVSLDQGQLVLAVAGTTASVQIYVQQSSDFVLGATLTGHEGWIRSLDFVRETAAAGSDYLLASASQDRYIRLWRFHKGSELPVASTAASDPSLGVLGRSLSNKAHYVGSGDSKHSITFEALLIGHEDWIYTARWLASEQPSATPRLLTASADNSLAIWEREPENGFWNCTTRLGEISAQKGSTSATGSTGGFWIGLWSRDGNTVTSLGRTGSWRQWKHEPNQDRWLQQVGISGHVKAVKDIAWSPDGAYLLSTGSDQTTRLFAEWKRDAICTWHEMARPQIHGYDLNCVDSLGASRFLSGADEKLLRVFNKPKAVANLLATLSGIQDSSAEDLPDAANMPVLGLSNKAITTAENEADATEAAAVTAASNDRDAPNSSALIHKTSLNTSQPPFEDQLARHTLWPEHEKLYGHGYEISAVAASHDGSLVATACRASSIDHAVIRLYETREWRELHPALASHGLTVTSLAFSPDDRYLLSTGRDRQWALFERGSSAGTWQLVTANPKGHSRMILDSSWGPLSQGSPGASAAVFATAGRDKSVKLWSVDATESNVVCRLTVSTSAAATAVAIHHGSPAGMLSVACGTEDGTVSVLSVDAVAWQVVQTVIVQRSNALASAINALQWRPDGVATATESREALLAIAGDDHSVRLYQLSGLSNS